MIKDIQLYKSLLQKYQIRQIEIESVSYNDASFKKCQKELNKIIPIIHLLEKYIKYIDEYHNLQELMLLPEFKSEAIAESNNLIIKIEQTDEEISEFLLSEAEEDYNKIIIEIRAGTGGDEASLFAADLLRMYLRFTDKQKWKHKMIDSSMNEAGGIKSCSVLLEGDSVYKYFVHESGVHRVQRIPITEANGRLHTSTATLSVLPADEDVNIEIEEKDLKIDTYRASGAGGQHVNKTESAIRITHLPSSIVVTCQDGRSQLDNRETAMKTLKMRLEQEYHRNKQKEKDDKRQDHIGSGDRSEKIRTYNYPENRITDHRYKITVYQLELMMNGEIEDFLKKVISESRKYIKNQ